MRIFFRFFPKEDGESAYGTLSLPRFTTPAAIGTKKRSLEDPEPFLKN